MSKIPKIVNGLYTTEHVLVALKEKGPMTMRGLWHSVRGHSGIESITKLRQSLEALRSSHKVLSYPDPNKKNTYFLLRLNPNKNFKVKIPENYEQTKQQATEAWQAQQAKKAADLAAALAAKPLPPIRMPPVVAPPPIIVAPPIPGQKTKSSVIKPTQLLKVDQRTKQLAAEKRKKKEGKKR